MVFYKILDHLKNILDRRFMSFNNIVNRFRALSPETLSNENISNREIMEMASELCGIYKADLDKDIFPRELVLFRKQMGEAISSSKTIKQLVMSAFCDNSSIASTFQEVFTAYVLFLTLPVTTATPERTFSKLKLIKNYLRSQMSQDRLSDLSLLSIEKEKACTINYEKVIEEFALANATRRHHFNM